MKIWQELALLMLLTGALIATLPRLFVLRRSGPVERERRRRLKINRTGRLGEATINDIQDDTVFYSYQIGGVAYQAAQDVSALRDRLFTQSDRLVGIVSVKYETGNPANSIIVCEQWSGVRPATRVAD
jgi:hypothetical protein